MIKSIILLILLTGAYQAYAQQIRVANDATPSKKKKGWYDWKVYLVASPAVLSSIKEVVYTFHPTFREPVKKVTPSRINRNFSYSHTGWGEFDIKVKIVYIDSRRTPLYLTHHLKLFNRSR